jgi:signal transduction histidine kinase
MSLDVLSIVFNLLILFIIFGSFWLILFQIKVSRTLRTGAGKYLLSGIAVMFFVQFYNVLDQIKNEELIRGLLIQPLYEIIDKLIPEFITIFYVIGSSLILYGTIKEFWIGERLAGELEQKSIILERQKNSLSNFTDIITHDARNYLMLIKGYSDLLKTNFDPLVVERIEDSVKKLDNLIETSKQVAQAGLIISNIKNNRLKQLANRAYELVNNDNIEVIFKENLPNILCDEEKIVIVLKNIIENAYIHGNAKKIYIETFYGETQLLIRISNDGLPIDEEYINEIWNYRFTTKNSNTGLGLYITKSIIYAHGWDIILKSKDPVSFEIMIPKSQVIGK